MFQQPNHCLNSPETAQSRSEHMSLSSELGKTSLQVKEVLGFEIQFNFENILRHLLCTVPQLLKIQSVSFT